MTTHDHWLPPENLSASILEGIAAVPGMIAALDFTPTCQCPAHSCTAPAQFVVEAHAIGHCEDDGLTVDGNHVQLLCEDCFTRLIAYVADGIARLRKITARPYCDECQAPISEIADVVRKVGAL